MSQASNWLTDWSIKKSYKQCNCTHLKNSLSFLTDIFPSEPGLAGLTEAKDDGSGGDNWSYKSCRAPVKSSPPTIQHPRNTRETFSSCIVTCFGPGIVPGGRGMAGYMTGMPRGPYGGIPRLQCICRHEKNNTQWKKCSERCKHCALAAVRWSQKFGAKNFCSTAGSHPGGAGRPKFNQLEMVTIFTNKPSLVRIDARNFELSW